jgi:CBS domain-containing protein
VKIQDVMTRNPRTVTPEAPAREAARIMQEEDIGVVPVVEGDQSRRLVGVITDRDIAIRVVAEGRDGDSRVREIMTSKLHTRHPDDDLDEAMDTMAEEQVRRVPVVDDRGELVGIISQADVVRKARDEAKAEDTVERISEPGGRHSQ